MSSRYAATDSPAVGIVWPALVAYSLVVCALHFGGLAYEVYTSVWWWDLLTHSLSGFGVAAWLCFVRVTPFDSRQVVAVSLAVLAIGAGFEWTTAYYATDTVIDLTLDALGAAAFALWHGRRAETGDAEASVATQSSR
jgi:hypothetical protein